MYDKARKSCYLPRYFYKKKTNKLNNNNTTIQTRIDCISMQSKFEIREKDELIYFKDFESKLQTKVHQLIAERIYKEQKLNEAYQEKKGRKKKRNITTNACED